MRKVISAALCLFLTVSAVVALSSCGEEEEKAYLRGFVYDKETNAPISGVTVYLNDAAYEVEDDGKFIYSDLVPGKDYTLKCSKEYYKSFSTTITAVFPYTDFDIEMELLGHDETKPSPIKNLSIDALRTFDFEVQHGVSEDQITISESGSFASPDRYQFMLSTAYNREMPENPGDDPQESPPQYCVQIGRDQWIDQGDGFYKNERFHIGFEDVFNGISYAIEKANKALENSDYVYDLGEYNVGGYKTKRLKTLTVITENYKSHDGTEKEQQILLELNVAVSIDDEFYGVPIDLKVGSFESIRQVKTFTHFQLSNMNIDFTIEPPEEGQTAFGEQ
ncbi:MAG TPA: carboxypeptidase-like regulatory domain-containing protein [Caldisericia bacterium]|nr:carboxypeptidase-like regulatory domain-containing protein [Caldisericia bacterium]HPF48989.1 carboxypeptidase-like regulatory domain-containing protein [Caldisericia bacterium]HPI83147.1 carboxypeptidase-like regulatory domain-containing protein [Caldisericia bacterium]HPQ92374.1 carboxypeptidase-like regulatory domain-containing protein [Caldisericia bacterium]HRV74528.1 carboxypeptidase-like regulatory domain-containing protein [Caldisericia bacterium]